jgi:hypothetical protein
MEEKDKHYHLIIEIYEISEQKFILQVNSWQYKKFLCLKLII